MDAVLEFGTKRENEERRDGGCAVVFDPLTQKYAVCKRTEGGFLGLFSGGVDPGEDIQEGIQREVVEESGLYDFSHVEKIGEAFAHYYNSLRNVNRVTLCTCLLIILRSAVLQETQLEEHEKFSLVWRSAEEILTCWNANNENGDVAHWIYFFDMAIKRIRELGYELPKQR